MTQETSLKDKKSQDLRLHRVDTVTAVAGVYLDFLLASSESDQSLSKIGTNSRDRSYSS
jgi:hypothetical protein